MASVAIFASHLCRHRYACWDARHAKGLFALVAHATSLDIGLPTTPPDTGEGCSRNGAPASTADSKPCASEVAPVRDPHSSEAALACLESLVTAAPLWTAAVNVWKRFSTSQAQQSVAAAAADAREACSSETGERLALDRPGDKETKDGGGDASHAIGVVDVTRLKFRVSVVRDGQHPFGSVEAAPRLGGAVWSVNRGWTVDLKVP